MTVFLVLIVLLVAISATYNAYLLRGGKMALSEVLIALGMVLFIVSFVVRLVYQGLTIFGNILVSDAIFIAGFVLLLAASLKLRASLKVKV